MRIYSQKPTAGCHAQETDGSHIVLVRETLWEEDASEQPSGTESAVACPRYHPFSGVAAAAGYSGSQQRAAAPNAGPQYAGRHLH